MKVRKGARSIKEIPPAILDQLTKGLIESVNLTEWLAIDHSELIKNILPSEYHQICLERLDTLKTKTAMQSIKNIGESLSAIIIENKEQNLFTQLSLHKSDSVRCWAAYIVGSDDTLPFEEKMKKIKAFAADKHFGVREISWMSVRSDIEANLEKAIQILTNWAKEEDENIRRFTTEAIRPNGVWSKQLEALKLNPEKALPILEQLKNDQSKYVQDSVANWLNDAAKTRPDFVITLCQRWENESDTPATKYIIKRATRTIRKK